MNSLFNYINFLKRSSGMLRKHMKTKSGNSKKSSSNNEHEPISISSEDEVELIKRALEKKHNIKFMKNVSLGGFINKPEYRLVLESVRHDFSDPYVFVIGAATENILDINEPFLKRFWEERSRHERIKRGEEEYENEFDKEALDQRDIAPSRNAFLLKAQIEGLLR